MNIKGIMILVITIFGFDILFGLLDTRYNLRDIFLFKVIPENWKGRWIIKWAFVFILLLILAILQVYSGLNDLSAYILAGFIMSLSNLLFKQSDRRRG